MCPIFVGSFPNFSRSDDDMLYWKYDYIGRCIDAQLDQSVTVSSISSLKIDCIMSKFAIFSNNEISTIPTWLCNNFHDLIPIFFYFSLCICNDCQVSLMHRTDRAHSRTCPICRKIVKQTIKAYLWQHNFCMKPMNEKKTKFSICICS